MGKAKPSKLTNYFVSGGLRNGYRYHHRGCEFHCMIAEEAWAHLETCTIGVLPSKSEPNDGPEATPLLTLDFFNWMAQELVKARTSRDHAKRELEIIQQRLVQSREALNRYQNGVVGAQLSEVYREYQKR